MPARNTPDQKPSPSPDEIDVSKKTLKDLPESGEDVKGGRRNAKTTLPPTLTTVQC